MQKYKTTIDLTALRKERKEAANNHNSEVVEAHDYHKDSNEVAACEIPQQMAGGYNAYISANSKRFTPSLLDYACGLLNNRDGSSHTWSVDDVVKALQSLGVSVDTMRRNELVYLANKFYALFYTSSVKDAAQCVKMAHDVVTAPNYYRGQVFDSWVAEMINRDIVIEWEKYK